MTTDLFAGTPVRDYATSAAWYERLFGGPPSFLPNDIEAVWQVAEHGYVSVVERPDNAGRAVHLLFVSDIDTRLREIAQRGLEPAERETLDSGVHKAVFHGPDGNEIGIGGTPA